MLHLSPEQFQALPRENREQILLVLAEMRRRAGQKRFYDLFPDADAIHADGTTIFAREKYPRHVEFFDAGREYRERCFMAANRVGKTTGGGYELTAHLTGEYPHWWTGRRFHGPIRAWAAGKSNETTRDIVQVALLGEIVESDRRKGFSGTGMIPGARLGIGTWKRGVSDLCDTIKIAHVSGGWSLLGFKSFEQGRGSFEGTAQHVILLDEECPPDVYGECLIRTATTNGIVMLTFTPLDGLTETVLQFMAADDRPKV